MALTRGAAKAGNAGDTTRKALPRMASPGRKISARGRSKRNPAAFALKTKQRRTQAHNPQVTHSRAAAGVSAATQASHSSLSASDKQK